MIISNNAHHFTCGERKIWQSIKKSQNIMKMIVGKKKVATSKMYIMRKNGRKFKSTPFLNLMITLNSFAFRVETV